MSPPAREDGFQPASLRRDSDTERRTARIAGQSSTTPLRNACLTASVRFVACSFPKIALRWNLTVSSLMPRRAAIALFDRPSARRVHHFELPSRQRLHDAASSSAADSARPDRHRRPATRRASDSVAASPTTSKSSGSRAAQPGPPGGGADEDYPHDIKDAGSRVRGSRVRKRRLQLWRQTRAASNPHANRRLAAANREPANRELADYARSAITIDCSSALPPRSVFSTNRLASTAARQLIEQIFGR